MTTSPTPAAPATGAGALPLANYDQLSLASLRARLRVVLASRMAQMDAGEARLQQEK